MKMHRAYPSGRMPKPPTWANSPSRNTWLFREHLSRLFFILAALILGIYLFLGGHSGDTYHENIPTGGPAVVLVTLIDRESQDPGYLKFIQDNREQYAALFGYEIFIANASDYDTGGAPKSWAKLMALRHTITKYPNCGHIWFLDQNALILDPKASLQNRLLDRGKLTERMLPETEVVPGSIIKTFGHLKAEDVSLIISQDKSGLVTDSMIIRNGEWGKFLLEQWLDPLYQSYNFGKAERHTLEHIVQWHPTVLSKIALVPQSILAPYSSGRDGEQVREGAFVVLFEGCQSQEGPNCAQELERFWPQWSAALKTLKG